MSAKISRVSVIKNVAIYSTYLILFWAFYRFLFQLPDTIEELFVKPIIWLVPLFYFTAKEKTGLSSLGLTFKNLVPSVYLSLGLGAFFVLEALATNFVKYGHFSFASNFSELTLSVVGLSVVTAFVEEVSFRGYIFSRLNFALKSELAANLVQTGLWIIIHVPIAFFIFNLTIPAALTYLFLTAIFGLGSAFVYAKTNNIWGSVLLHLLWGWPIILFR